MGNHFPSQTGDRLGKLLHGEETRLTAAFLADEIAWRGLSAEVDLTRPLFDAPGDGQS